MIRFEILVEASPIVSHEEEAARTTIYLFHRCDGTNSAHAPVGKQIVLHSLAAHLGLHTSSCVEHLSCLSIIVWHALVAAEQVS